MHLCNRYRKPALLFIAVLTASVTYGQWSNGLNRGFIPYMGRPGYYLQLLQNRGDVSSLLFDPVISIQPFSYYDPARKENISDLIPVFYDSDMARQKIKDVCIIMSDDNGNLLKLAAIADKQLMPDSNSSILRLAYKNGFLTATTLKQYHQGRLITDQSYKISIRQEYGQTKINVTRGTDSAKNYEQYLSLTLAGNRLTEIKVYRPKASGGNSYSRYQYNDKGFLDKIIRLRDTMAFFKSTPNAGRQTYIWNSYLQHPFIKDSLRTGRQQTNLYAVAAPGDSSYFIHRNTDSQGRGFYFVADRHPLYNLFSGHLYFFNYRNDAAHGKLLLTEGYDNELQPAPAFAPAGTIPCLSNICRYFETASVSRAHGQTVSILQVNYYLQSAYGNTDDYDCNNRLFKAAYALPAGVTDSIAAYANVQRILRYDIAYRNNGLVDQIQVNDSLVHQLTDVASVGQMPSKRMIYFIYRK